MSELASSMDYTKFFNQVLKLDSNIRLVAIYDGRFKAIFRDRIQGYLEDEEIKSTLSEAQKIWDSRIQMSLKVTEPKFAMTRYSKVNQITIPMDDGVILMTTELDVNINELTDKVIETRIRFFD